MATAEVAQPPIDLNIHASDRLGLTIFFAVVLHSLIILGVSFAQPDKKKPPEKLPGLEVTLVQSKTDKEITEADFMAQEDQEGGGLDQEAERASSPVEPEVATGKAGEVSEQITQLFVPQASEKSRMQVLTSTKSDVKLQSEKNKKEIDTAETKEASAKLLTMNKEIAKQSAEIDLLRAKYKNRPRKAFLSSQTMKYRYASYEEAWRKKIERTGTLEFPDEARRKKLSGTLVMAVTVRKDGTVADIKITKFSNHKILDDGAKRIVKMAAPFPPFNKEMSSELDEITIIRTWQFLQGSKLRTRR